MSRFLIALGLLAITSIGAGHRPFTAAYAAGPQAAAASPQPARTAAAVTSPAPPSRALLDKYCVGCHNDRLKSGNLVLTNVDVADVSRHAALLEKVARKLRGRTMPPEGAPRPDAASMDAFIASIESALDRAAAASPNPGRVASHRLNRAEYVNAVRDLLGLDVNGAELLPSDMAGFGFDNNADVLSMTPALMSRYMAAATKISRLAMRGMTSS